MTESATMDWERALAALLLELTDGSPSSEAYVLNPGDRGLFGSLDQLSGEAASARPATGGASIAAHVDHLCYGLDLMNRWRRGEPNPFADANFAASWERPAVSDGEWLKLRERLRHEVASWREVLDQPMTLDDVERAGVVSSVVHLAYHMGAIRQIDRAVRGPQARD